MGVNMYDQAAQMPIINTYVPINFGELYRIAATQKEEIDKANQALTTNLQKFGEFRSPSKVDTENYYKYTIGQFQDILQEAANNPNAMKDAAFRAKINQRLNNLDYASLSMLKESAEMQRAGLEQRAKMEAAGKYNRNWDHSDIPNYDTLGTGKVFDDISPVMWMSANELSNPYFNDLQNSTLKSVYRNGIRYNRSGVTYQNLYDIANAKFNDIVVTPQGREYYNDFLQIYGNPEDAKDAFVNMIADSQRDRIRINEEVDPVSLVYLKKRLSDNDKQNNGLLNRTQMLLADSQISRISNFTNLSRQKIADFLQKGLSALTPEEQQEIQNANSKQYRSDKLWGNWLPLLASGLTPYQATDAISDMLRSPMSFLSAEDYSKTNTNGKQDSNGYYSANTTRNFELTRNLVYDEMDYNNRVLVEDNNENRNPEIYYDSKAWQTLTDIWNRPNSINDFKISPVPSQITTEKGNYAEQMALIPYEALRNEFLKQDGVTEQNVDIMLSTLGNQVQINEPKVSTTVKKDNRGNVESTTENISTQGGMYIQIPVGTKIQTRGEAAVTPDAMYTKERLSSTIRDTQNAKSEYENYGIQ